MSIITNALFNAVTAFTAIAGVVGEADDETFTKNAHGLLDGQEVVFTSLTGGGDAFVVGTSYFVRDKDANTFKLAEERGGDAVAFDEDITDATIIRVGMGVPTGWTVTVAGSSEILAGADEALSPCKMPINTYAELHVDAVPSDCNMAQEITLAPGTRYRLSVEAYWLHQDPAQKTPAHAPTVTLQATGEAHYLTSTGAFQAGANAIPIPVKAEKGSRLAIVFETPATHTAYTLTIDKGTMDGTAGYLEIVRLTNVKIEPVAFDDHAGLPENNSTAHAALPENC